MSDAVRSISEARLAPGSLGEMLLLGGAEHGSRAALITADGASVSYDELIRAGIHVLSTLRSNGVGPDDRVVVMSRGGPDALATLLGTMLGAVCVPIDPTIHRADAEHLLKRISPSALFVESLNHFGVELAAAQNVPVLEIPSFAEGDFNDASTLHLSDLSPAKASDDALILCTSGTSGTPKLVAHTHAGLRCSASALAERLKLDPTTCTLNPVPSHYMHGLVAGTLCYLAAGARVICAPTTNPNEILRLIDQHQPTCYTAVPTMHQAVVRAACSNGRPKGSWPLSFVASAGAPLLEKTRDTLEDTFGVPVLERYAMTESPVLAANGFGDDYRIGTVGRAVGCELAVVVEGEVLSGSDAFGQVGEIVVRGPSVTTGYLDDKVATEDALRLGWFRTGDIGHLDADGFLSIRGRVKELIVRGGMNISPLAIEDVLVSHPNVLGAIAFSIPHATLGEEIVAAVVANHVERSSTTDIRKFALDHLGLARAPKHILLVDEIPTGRSGKVDRFGPGLEALRSLVLGGTRDDASLPASPVTAAISGLMADILERSEVGPDEDFFLLGGDSLSLVTLQFDVEELFSRSFDLNAFVENPTAANLEVLLQQDPASDSVLRMAPTRIQVGGCDTPLFCVFTWNSNLSAMHALLPELGPERPVYASSLFQLRGDIVMWESVEQAAEHFVSAIREVQPEGPFLLCGRSFAGLVAYEASQILTRQGETVKMLALFDSWFSSSKRFRLWRRIRRTRDKSTRFLRKALRGMTSRQAVRSAIGFDARPSRNASNKRDMVRPQFQAHIRGLRSSYSPPQTSIPIVLFRTKESKRVDRMLGWKEMFKGPYEIIDVRGTHRTMLDQPYVSEVARHLQRCIASSESFEAALSSDIGAVPVGS